MSSSQCVPCQALHFSQILVHFQILFYLSDTHSIHIKIKMHTTFANYLNEKKKDNP